jgi:peptide/nickel transport system substrate-binding protein
MAEQGLRQDWSRGMTRRRVLQLGGGLGLAWVLGVPLRVLAPRSAHAAAGGNVLRVGIDIDPVTLDTRITQPVSACGLIMQVNEPLVHRDGNMKTIGLLAESWEAVPSKGWRFKLRRGVKFHNGEDFNADSVKYTIESYQDQNLKWVHTQSRAYVTAIEKVEIENPYSVVMVTKGFSRALVSQLSAVTMLPPKAAAQAGQQFGLKPIGTGRYRFVEYVPGSQIILEANPDYWGQKARNGRLELRILKENSTRLAALESGEVKLINNVPPDAVNRLKNRPDLVVVQVPTTRLMHIQMQYDRGVFADKRLRHAVNYAIDKEALVKSIMGGMAEVARNPWSPSAIGTNKSLPQYDYNPAKAQQLMAEAGKPNGFEFTFGSPAGRYLQDKLMAEAIVQQLAKANIKAQLDAREWGGFWQNLTERKYDAGFVGYAIPTMDPEWAAQWLWKSSLVGFKNDKVKQLFQAADATPDVAKADQLYQEAQVLVWDDAPFAQLYFQPEIDAHSKDVKGWKPRADEYLVFWDAEI